MKKTRTLHWFIFIVSFLIILLGAYIRLVDGGLGCPQWPTCYGKLSISLTENTLLKTKLRFSSTPSYTWQDLLHPYLSAIYTLCTLLFSGYYIYINQQRALVLVLASILLSQLFLELWITSSPLIITLNLFIGLISSLTLFVLLLGPRKNKTPYDKWGYLILSSIVIQIFFGTWTSANYSSLVCPDFPFCQAKLFPPLSAQKAILLPFGILEYISHLTYRYFAIITSTGITGFILHAFYHQTAPWHILFTTSLLVALQVILGIINALFLIPLQISIAHNIIGFLLLLSWIWLIHSLSTPSSEA